MNIDYATLEHDLGDGSFCLRLEEELTAGFRQIHETGERLPLASYLATQIAEIANRGVELSPEVKYDLYQEILLACERARATVLGEEPSTGK
jgi:hypothetical protein